MHRGVWNAFAIEVGVFSAFAAGAILAVAFDNVPLGVVFGILVGIVVGALVWRRSTAKK